MIKIFPKLKSIPILYSFKTSIRYLKFLIKNKSNLSVIISFIYINLFFRRKYSFEQYYVDKKFDHPDWFLSKTNIFRYSLFNLNDFKISNILEIGSFEGRSAIFFLNTFKNSDIDCVDTWKGSDEHASIKMGVVEQNFDFNTREFFARINKYKTDSKSYFEANVKRYDLIYIDGSHHYEDVLRDGESALNHLNTNGYILFDDYTFTFHKYANGKNVINAVNYFYKKNKTILKLIYAHHQILFKKIK